MLSPCCGVQCYEALGDVVCSACYAVMTPTTIRITAQPRDIMAWVFTPRDRTGKPIPPGPRPPKGCNVLVRNANGKRIRKVDKIRGQPDAWFWIDA